MTPKKEPVATLLKYSDIKPKVILTQTVQDQIKYLCDKMSTVEWSGVLYHTSEGDIDDPLNFVCKAEYILLLDKGSAAYTSYDFASELFTNAIFERPDLLDFQAAQIHSHNNMATFFSGTDNDELTDNASNYNYYLSLIVNNKNEMCAKIAFVGEIGGREIKFKNKQGEDKVVTTVTTQHTFFYDVDIVKESSLLIDDFFVKQYAAVLADSVKISQPSHLNYMQSSAAYGWNAKLNNKHGSQQQLSFDKDVDKGFYDMEAISLLKYLLVEKTNDRSISLLVILKNYKTHTPKGKMVCQEWISKRISNADKIFTEFTRFSEFAALDSDLEDLWDRMVLVLSMNDYIKYDVSKMIIEELKLYSWTTS